MARTNVPNVNTKRTHEGAMASMTNAEQDLRRSLMACLLWESTFYEEGVEIAQRIAQLVAHVDPDKVAAMAIEAREKNKLRHAPLWVVRAMAAKTSHKRLVADTLARIIQRADELTEFLSLYWLGKRTPLSAQVKKGLARAFTKFDAYQLAKYNRDGAVKLRDVLFLCHAKPINDEQAETWKKLVDGTLESPDTWEVNLSAGKDKKETFERLIREKNLGALALLRNLRNMDQAGVDEELIFGALAEMNVSRVLPFRFITAARYAPQWESKLEVPMLKAIDGREKLPGKTVLVIDVSGSMDWNISDKSEVVRIDAAAGLAILARELCENVAVYTFSSDEVRVPDRHGFALRDAIINSQPHAGTWIGKSVKAINVKETYDRIVVFTDEQAHDDIPNPNPGSKGYIVNVAAYKNGIGYGSYTHIDGWSESIFDYITQVEK